MEKIKWEISPFGSLDIDSLYKILRLRCEVFIVEQQSPYLDVDDKDRIALHLQGYIGEDLVAYCRLFKAGGYFEEASVGRVVIPRIHRGKGYGYQLMDKAVELLDKLWAEKDITISAQLYLEKFYGSYGFVRTGSEYREDGLPHIKMKKKFIPG